MNDDPMNATDDEGTDRRLAIRTMAPAGASQDLLLRLFVPILREQFGTELLIENAPGQDGMVAARLTRNEPADGRHLLLSGSATLTFYPATGTAGYAESDFEPLLGIGRYNFVVVTVASRSWLTLHDALAEARSEGRALRYAGSGQPDFLLVQAMAAKAGVAVEFLQLNGQALLDAVLTEAADIGLGTGTHQLLLEQGRMRVMAKLHPRGQPGGDAPSPRDFGVEATLNTFILIAAPKGIALDRKADLISMLRKAAETPQSVTLVRDRLSMLPLVLLGPELETALAEQKRDFARLTSPSPLR